LGRHVDGIVEAELNYSHKVAAEKVSFYFRSLSTAFEVLLDIWFLDSLSIATVVPSSDKFPTRCPEIGSFSH
jgi:hypothetical protein